MTVFEATTPRHPEALLKAALDLATQGYRVFPLRPNGRLPAIFNWSFHASFDAEKVKAMWMFYDPGYKIDRVKDYNIGIATGRTRDGWLTVFDVDVKNGGKGRESVANLDMMALEPWLDTKRVETLSGGDHLYYETDGPLANTCSKLAPNIDTRGEGGYVVAPGSTVDGRSYIDHGGDTRKAPDWMVAAIGAAPDRSGENVVLCTLDAPATIERATTWLATNAEVAIEGSGGNFTTLKVAMRVKDLGLSQQGCCELLFAKWNDRCEPPWEYGELAKIVENAYLYGKNGIGSSSPEADFGAWTPEASAASVQVPTDALIVGSHAGIFQPRRAANNQRATLQEALLKCCNHYGKSCLPVRGYSKSSV